MKQKFTVAIIAAASIVLFSCDWFDSKKQDHSNPLVGRWKLDSLRAQGKDSTMPFILSYQSLKDSAEIIFEFKKDTVVTISGDHHDTSLYSWNQKEKQFIPADSSERIYQFVQLNDSSVTLTSKDSTVYFLQKR